MEEPAMVTSRWFFWVKLIMSMIIAQTTEFVPDEYWQSTEVASYLHFGKGHLTWEWHEGLRSYIFPLVISWVYKIGSLFGLDYSPWFLSGAPQALQLALYAYACYWFEKYAVKYYGRVAADCAMTIMITNWFTTYCASRMIINQTELSLNMIALGMVSAGYWTRFSIVLGLNFIVRPTALIFWWILIPDVMDEMVPPMDSKGRENHKNFFLSLAVGTLVIGLGGLLDYTMTGKLSWLEFFKFNCLQGGSEEFGAYPRFWYLYEGLPSMLGPIVVLILFTIDLPKGIQGLKICLLFYVFVYSLLAHKEIRFLLPVMPVVSCILGCTVHKLHEEMHKRIATMAFRKSIVKTWRLAMWLFLLTNVAGAVCIGLFHQSGIRPATRFIHNGISNMENPNVWILTPCYNVPVHTYMPHPNANYVYYVCAPKNFQHLFENGTQLMQRNGFETVDVETDITKKLDTTSAPDFVLAFESTVPVILKTFTANGLSYEVCATFRHTFDLFKSAYISVLCHTSRPFT